MNPQIKQKIEEILRVIDRLKNEVEETRGYINQMDTGTALRNQNDNRDKLQDLVRKWDELNRLLNQR